MNNKFTFNGPVISDLRMKAGMRIEDLAAKSGLSLSTIQNIESGRTSPSIRTLRKIATALEVETHWLVKKIEEKNA